MNIKKITLITLFSLILSSCGLDNSSSVNRFTEDQSDANVYSSAEKGKISSVAEGIILSIKRIKISGSQALGAGVGGVLGASIAENAVGGEKDKEPARIIGGLLGAIVGKSIEKKSTESVGFEFLVKLDSGEIKSFVQNSSQGLIVGDNVYVIYGEKTARLTLKK
jgi:outer membrane lipoprotein SlyB